MALSRVLRRPITWYIAANVAAAGLILWATAGGLASARAPVVLTWLAASILAEWLWLESITGQGSHSMASTFNYAAIFVLPASEAVWVVALSVWVGALVFQRRPWYRALFAAANVTVVVFVAAHVYAALGGAELSLDGMWTFENLVPYTAAGVTFFLANTFGVAAAIALAERQTLLEVWRRNFGYSFELLGTVALFLISPILVIAYLAVGAPAFVLFALPLLVIRKGNRDYIELERTQASVVAAERLAAKGEMAAGIAHELNNSLAALKGGTQLMERQITGGDTNGIERRLAIVLEQVESMTVLTEGLMAFSHREVVLARVDLQGLVTKTVTFLAPQPRFHGIEIAVDAPVPVHMEVDAAQLQQVLVNLLHNAADALAEAPDAPRAISIRLRRTPKRVSLAVRDEGPGMSAEVRARIFDPTFTTKAGGHGFGLATSQRIAANHGGSLEVESEPGRGTTMTLQLPGRGSESCRGARDARRSRVTQ